ncbi:nuclear transport factor 2 family protein [Acinetobacter shaoyimingii]|uniref:SnoaL-like domain-containing protein n=1 Tax=Acinetobacter shaoyimingii TaxID=2715164 RepID=A0A6G8RYW0_9GAMM|nr:nuclear transport factor 2 family protein [Acinetobacter shaoyimingii]QIO06923.1 SnoaL-like domain-containing protein [Acinetobacter shaoyimingii]
MNIISLQKTLVLSSLALSLFCVGCSNHPQQVAAAVTGNTLDAISAQQTAERNKKIVTDFYEGVFIKHQVKEYSDLYIGNQYIQHNPHVPDGKAPFVDYFTGYFKQNPKAKNVIKRAVAEGDLVFLHVHSTENEQDLGVAVVDIFRVENGKIVEHWDVQQQVPEKAANTNTMF